jgi:hypothetical protein
LSNILFGENQYSMTGYVIGSNGNELAKYSSSLTPNVLFAGSLSKQQQEEDLAAWISNLDSRQTPLPIIIPASDGPVGAGGGGPLISIPVQPTVTLTTIPRLTDPGPATGAEAVPEPATGALLIVTLILFALAKRFDVHRLCRSPQTLPNPLTIGVAQSTKGHE